MEGFMIRGWDLLLLGWRWLYEPWLSSDQPAGLGFTTPSGGHRFRLRCDRFVDIWKDF